MDGAPVSVLIFELGAPLWFLWRRTRPFAILFGLSFHRGIALLMKAVWVFSLQMIAFYPIFMSERFAADLLHQSGPRFRVMSARMSRRRKQ
jgi:hypothetical protein